MKRCIPVRLIVKDKGGKKYFKLTFWVQMFWKMREYQKKGAVKQKIEASLYTLVSRKFNLLFTLYTYVIANIFQNDANFRYSKAGLENYKNLNNFRQAKVQRLEI